TFSDVPQRNLKLVVTEHYLHNVKDLPTPVNQKEEEELVDNPTPSTSQAPPPSHEVLSTSLPSRRERREWNKRQELERALGEGNQARISQLSIAETSIANKELSDDPWEITTTTPASPQEDVKTTTMDPELQKAIEKKKKIELDKIQTEAAKFKKRMFKNLESNNVDNLDDCTQQMSTVSAIIGDGDTIDLNGRDMAVD
ncbi:hypothetical protein Hamer_G011590, partial [Homarus americanus]